MLQSILPLLEIILFGSIVYLFWRLRNLLSDSRFVNLTQLSSDQAKLRTEAIRIAHDLSGLLQEFEAATTTIGEDLYSKINACEDTLERVEAAKAELYTQVNLVESHQFRLANGKNFSPSLCSRSSPPLQIDSPVGADPNWRNLEDINSIESQIDQFSEMNRYQAVVALAHEGFDVATISLRTGLEREAIRILLSNQSQVN